MSDETALLTEMMLQAEMFCAQIESRAQDRPRNPEQDELRLKIGQCRGALAQLQSYHDADKLKISNPSVRALQNVSAFTWIEIEHDMSRLLNARHPVEKGRELQRRHIRRPGKRLDTINEDVLDVGSALATWHWEGLDPLRREVGRVLLVKRLAVHAIRVALRSYRSVAKVRQQERRDSSIIPDYVSLSVFGRAG